MIVITDSLDELLRNARRYDAELLIFEYRPFTHTCENCLEKIADPDLRCKKLALVSQPPGNTFDQKLAPYVDALIDPVQHPGKMQQLIFHFLQ